MSIDAALTVKNVLVIRLGALGDLVFCFRSFAAIRQAHPQAKIALLTRPAFAALAARLPWVDRVIIETHPRFGDLRGWWRLRRAIADFNPTRIYDLQGKRRQSILYALLGGPWGADWSGAAPFCRYPRLWPPPPGMHFTEFLAAQLQRAGIHPDVSLDLDWLDAPVAGFNLPEKYLVVVPGCSPSAPFKRWPPARYGELARLWQARGWAVIAVGSASEAELIGELGALAPGLIDLAGRTDLFELAGILRRAGAVIGNDTGPAHLAAALGAPTLALFSGRSDPAWSRPPGDKVMWLQEQKLENLSVARVDAALQLLVEDAKNKAGQGERAP